eukprot:CAMPEP_0173400074 /NCGR_PEP_ID=MMETSP1356-20130122/46872_2 /TAXON_ID=77927 ORGANISM="Hemiselmis virescens, Strain PCC157" /NCGR_SAMPLE_ID=MMETSP1356 /ASSEMBLY_ACC=CAM_ASM_000847 /LENGTH=33 /DNA_ID= /DNA_START= /DNA_END= /DNA_ORIENTATION=
MSPSMPPCATEAFAIACCFALALTPALPASMAA